MTATNQLDALSQAFMRAHPEDVARLLEVRAPSEVVALLQELPARIMAPVLQCMRPSLAAAVLHGVDRNRGSVLLAMLETSVAARALRQVDESHRVALLAPLRTAKGVALRLILALPDDSIGTWVDADVMTLTGEVTAGAARDRAAKAAGNAGHIVLLDDQQRPTGWLLLHELLRAAPTTPVAKLAVPIPAMLLAATPLAAGLLHPAWRLSSVLPVTTRFGTFIGLLRHERLQQVYDMEQSSRGSGAASAGGVLAGSYWQGVTGVLRGALTALPTTRALAEIPRGR